MKRKFLILFTVIVMSQILYSQTIYQYENKDVKLLFFDKNISMYVPHIVSEISLGLQNHSNIWDNDSSATYQYRPQQLYMYLTDWGDDGNGGATPLPNNLISVGMSPLNNTYDVSPSIERYRHLAHHELTHIYNTDKSTLQDNRWRKFFGTKVSINSESPITALWSYLTVPRWYNPRWYQEGIACFLETAMGGGVGRALGTYDEMYFRSLIKSGEPIYSAVGLEAEGTSADFQVGATSYLYGTRFVNFLAAQYGTDSLYRFYNRTEDSKSFFSSQFQNVYNKSLSEVWDEWRAYEKEHQQSNIEAIREYPLTELTPLYKNAMGSVCPPIYDSERERLYLAANYRGKFAHISYIDLKTGKEKILRKVDEPALYYTTYLTFDKKRNRLIYTTNNSDIRGIEAIDADTGRRLFHQRFHRVSNIVYDNARDYMYGIMTNGGVNCLIRYSSDLKDRQILYSFSFGQSVSGLRLSSNGLNLIAQLSKQNGNSALILFSIKDLEEAVPNYEEIIEIDNINLLNFEFADNDSTLIGTSNYTGVQNIWSIDRETKEMKLLSNVETGLFAPIPYKRDSLIALHYEKDGMRPVKLARKEIKDANTITLLGQLAYERNPDLEALSKYVDVDENFADVYNNITEYKPIKEMRFAGAYPDISGFRDKNSKFNGVTPVLGYNFFFSDPIGISSIKLNLGISPWSSNDLKNQFHAKLQWKFWSWTFTAAYNPTNFYDLVGPTQRSRKGYNFGINYNHNFSVLSSIKSSISVAANTFGMMDALPLYQNVSSPVESMQTLDINYSISKSKATLGGVTAESGYSFSVNPYSYFAVFDGKYKAFPSLSIQADKGFLLPVGRSNSFWLRSAFGQSFSEDNSSFSKMYFGGFRNNLLDNGSIYRYRSISAFPGATIDEIPAHSFAKLMAELSFTPIRFSNFGSPLFYPNHITFSVFSSDLMANPWGNGSFRNYVNIGAQVNIQMVLFSYMNTTWSFGYAHLFRPDGSHNNELMFSLKLF